jgi:hypothetical protein
LGPSARTTYDRIRSITARPGPPWFADGGAPAPPSQVLLIVDFGTIGLSIHISGPAVTVAEAVKIEEAVLGD